MAGLIYPFSRVMGLARRNESNIGFLALRTAVDRGWSLFDMVGGFEDVFEDDTGVDDSQSQGAIYNAGAKAFALSASGTIDIASVGQTIYGAQDSGYPATNAFDDNFNTSAWTPGSGNAEATSWIGQDFGSAKNLAQITYRGGDNGGNWTSYGFRSIAIDYSDDAAAWVVATTFVQPNDTTKQTYDVPDVGAHRYWRWRATAVSNAGGWYGSFGDIEAFERIDTLALVSISCDLDFEPVAGRALIVAAPDPGAVLNTDLIAELSRDGGATWAAATLTKAADYSSTLELWETTEADMAGQPTGQALRVRLRSPTGTGATVHGWYVQAR